MTLGQALAAKVRLIVLCKAFPGRNAPVRASVAASGAALFATGLLLDAVRQGVSTVIACHGAGRKTGLLRGFWDCRRLAATGSAFPRQIRTRLTQTIVMPAGEGRYPRFNRMSARRVGPGLRRDETDEMCSSHSSVRAIRAGPVVSRPIAR
jgi:hypothetical protein